jgi:TPR repeat protein
LKHAALSLFLAAATCLAQQDPPDIKAIEKRANAGEAKAQLTLGLIYDEGVGVERDRRKAAVWLEKAAEQGVPEAQFNIGTMYEIGVGVRKDEAKALEWFEKAATQGLVDAQFNLANMYATGRGTKQDIAKAAEWYEKAATRGMTRAQVNLALLYMRGEVKGQGIPRNNMKGYAWFSLAAADGDPTGKKSRDFIERKLNAEQKAMFRKAAAELAATIKKQ